MRIIIPKIVVPVELIHYNPSPELQGKFLHVWVNPPKEKLQEYDDLVTAVQEQSLEDARKTLGSNVERRTSNVEGRTTLERVFDQLTAMVKGRRDSKVDGLDEKLLRWYAEIWSCGPENERWTVAELREIEEQDPAFLSWMIAQTWSTREEHIQHKKKV